LTSIKSSDEDEDEARQDGEEKSQKIELVSGRQAGAGWKMSR
jgi:hypothetical protein